MAVVSVGFIGSGRLAERVARNLVQHVAPQRTFCYHKQRLVSTLLASDPSDARRRVFTRLGFTTTAANRDVLAACDVVFLGTDARTVLAAHTTNARTLYVSLMGTLPARQVEALLCPGAKVIRLMPQSDLEKKGLPKGVLPPRSWVTVRGSHVTRRDLAQVVRLAGIDTCIEVDENSTSWCFAQLREQQDDNDDDNDETQTRRICDGFSAGSDRAVAGSRRAVHTLGGEHGFKSIDGIVAERNEAGFHETYAFVRELVAGRFSCVSEVMHRATGHRFAVKAVELKDEKMQEAQEMVRTEVAALERLKHPHIIAHHGVYKHERTYLLVLEYCNYGSVRKLIDEHKAVPEQVAKGVLKQTLAALDYCHTMGHVHRDVKAENVLLCTSDNGGSFTVKLADFGLSEDLQLGTHRPYSLCGTPQYLSPELVSGRRSGPPADIWSTGILAYMMLSGMVPFHEARSDTELFKLISLGAVWYDQAPWHGISPAAKDFVQQMLEVSTESRPSAAELLRHAWLQDP